MAGRNHDAEQVQDSVRRANMRRERAALVHGLSGPFRTSGRNATACVEEVGKFARLSTLRTLERKRLVIFRDRAFHLTDAGRKAAQQITESDHD